MQNPKKIVASIQVFPLNTSKDTTYEMVEKTIHFIKSNLDIEYRLGVMSTTIGGEFNDVMKMISRIQQEVLLIGDNEYIMNINIHGSNNMDIEIGDKENKFVGI